MQRAFSAPPAVFNRLRAVLIHVPFYATDGLARLADDTGLSRPSIWRYANLQQNPGRAARAAIARSISEHTGLRIVGRDIFSKTGVYSIPSACELMECCGCLPAEAWDPATLVLKPEWQDRPPGEWSHQDCHYWHYEERANYEEKIDDLTQETREWSRLEADPTHLVSPFN